MNRSQGLWALLPLVLAGCSDAASEPTVLTRRVEAGELQLLPGDGQFAAVQDLVLAGGAIWVLDDAPPFVTRVSLEDGSVVRFGREGRGPGGFLGPRAIQPTVEPDSFGIRVWDPGNNRVSAFDQAGRPLGSERLSDEGRIRARSDIRKVSYADPFRIRSAGTDIVFGHFPRRIDRTADLAMGALRRADDRLNPWRDLAQFSDHMQDGVSSLREWSAVLLWDTCDKAVVLWSPRYAQVIWLDPHGVRTASRAVGGDPTPLGVKDIEAYLRWMARLELGPDHEEAGINYADLARRYRDRFAEHRPYATDLRCQGSGVAWIRLFDTSVDPLGRGQAWLRVSTDGALQRIRFPTGFTPFAFTEQGMYGAYEVSEGYQQLVWWSTELTR